MSRIAHLGLSLATFAITFAMGMWCFSERRPRTSNAPGTPAAVAADAMGNAHSFGPTRAVASDELLTAIMSAVAEEEPLRRAHRLHDLFAHLSSAELGSLFERAVHVEDPERRDAVLTALLTRWTEIDPATADAAVKPYRDRLHALVRIPWQSLDNAVNAAWAKAAPENALAEAIAAPDTPWAYYTIEAALETLAGGDPARRLDILSRVPAGRWRSQMCADAITALAKKDSAAAEQKLDLLTEPRQRARVEAEILGKLAERDPAAGLARLAALAPDLTLGTNGSRLLTKILFPVAKKDPAAALAALDDVPDELFQTAAGAVLVGWAVDHPVEALDWAVANGIDVAEAKAIQQFGEDGNSWSALVATALNANHDKTMAWLLAQPASSERDAMLRQAAWAGTSEQRIDAFNAMTPEAQPGAVNSVLSGFENGSIAKAEAWVKELPPGPVRSAGVDNLAILEYYDKPDQADTLAEAWPAGPERDAALGGIASSLGSRDPQHALNLASRIGDPNERERASELIARTWLGRDETAARAWLATTGAISAAAKRVLLREFTNR